MYRELYIIVPVGTGGIIEGEKMNKRKEIPLYAGSKTGNELNVNC